MNKKTQVTATDYVRLANNFYISKGINSNYNRIAIDFELNTYLGAHIPDLDKKFKIAFCCICLNEPYWQYAKDMIEGAKNLFLPGHQVDFFLWSDMPETYGATVFPTEPIEWPMPTLMRYSLFLQQEEKLKEYDYIFYCDVDMRFVDVVGDEILGDGLTAAQHPMYALRKEYIAPYEPNEKSASYIPRSGRVINDNGKPRFLPLYFAGGFQGGRTKEWLAAMKQMKKMVDKDLSINYIPIWNDETVWNKYLFENPPSVVLTPSYIYPDSLIKEYYEPLWGCSYPPKIVTLTKKHTISKEGGEAVQKMLNSTKPLQ